MREFLCVSVYKGEKREFRNYSFIIFFYYCSIETIVNKFFIYFKLKQQNKSANAFECFVISFMCRVVKIEAQIKKKKKISIYIALFNDLYIDLERTIEGVKNRNRNKLE